MYEIAMKNREFELQIFWQRLLFFVGFLASILVALTQDKVLDDPWLQTLLCCAGILVSLSFWFVINAAKYWSENWESKVKILEEKLGYEFWWKQKGENIGDIICDDKSDDKSSKLLTNSLIKSKCVWSEKRPSITTMLHLLSALSICFFSLWICYVIYIYNIIYCDIFEILFEIFDILPFIFLLSGIVALLYFAHHKNYAMGIALVILVVILCAFKPVS